MIVRVLVLYCDFCRRTTRIKGSRVTDDGLYSVARKRRWRVTPHPAKPDIYTPDARCPTCAKNAAFGEPWAGEQGDRLG